MIQRLIPISSDFSVDFKHWWLDFYQPMFINNNQDTIKAILRQTLRAFCIDKDMLLHKYMRTDAPKYYYPSVNDFASYIHTIHFLICAVLHTHSAEPLQPYHHVTRTQANLVMQYINHLNVHKTTAVSLQKLLAYVDYMINSNALSLANA